MSHQVQSVLTLVPDGVRVFSLRALWWGVCAGGRHYVGEVAEGGYRHELTRQLSLREATALGETQRLLWTRRVSRLTNRFDDLESLERAAVKWCAERAGKSAWLLVEHGDAWLPRPIGAGGWLGERLLDLRSLHGWWASRHNSERNEVEQRKLAGAWRALVRVPGAG